MKIKSLLLVLAILSICTLNLFAQGPLKYYCLPCNSDCDKIAFDKPGKCPHCGMGLIGQTEDQHNKLLEGKKGKKLKVAFYLQNNVEILDFAGPLEVLSYAGMDIFTVSKTTDPITTQRVVKVIPQYSIANAPQADIVMFFGGNAGEAADDPAVIDWLTQKQKPQYFVSVCTGAFVLAKAGLLDDKSVTTFHLSIDELKKAAPKAKVLSDVRFVDNGMVITTAGISAGIDGTLHLVAKLYGDDAAKEIAAYMEYDKWIPGQGLVMKK